MTPSELVEKLREFANSAPGASVGDIVFQEAIDCIDSLTAELAEANAAFVTATEQMAKMGGELERLKAEAIHQEERADGYSAWITTFEKREARYREALEWYATEWLYDLQSYRTASPLSEVNVPRNIEVDGNPVMHDRGKKAHEALASDRDEGE